MDALRIRPVMGSTYSKYDPIELQIANIMHLVDLKRAGHSPTRTELAIRPSDTPVRVRKASQYGVMSMTGSPAAYCATVK